MTFHEYPDLDMLALRLADQLASNLRQALDRTETVLFVVPGGTTPGPIFDTLSAVDLEWARVRVLLSDERWVPEDDPRSNTKLVRERLLTGRAAAAQLVPLHEEGLTPHAALEKLTEGVEPTLPIDVCLLGMGADMHTASLFPGAPGLNAALGPEAPILTVQTPDGQPETRISLSARVLRDAVALHVVITGAAKKEAVERAVHLPPEEAPIAALLDRADIHWAE
ncbi:MAG: 6-phosphogluconolactonase [Pseudomonadota bacterium]